MKADPSGRERECFELLQAVQEEELILIGGYAIDAYGRPRFSIDLDLVMAEPTAVGVRGTLADLGCRRVKTWGGGPGFSGTSERWERGPKGQAIAVDLLVGGVLDRNSGVSFSYGELRRMSSRREVRGVDPSRAARPLVASREVLIALKLSAGREVDLRDVAALSRGSVDYAEVVELLRRVPRKLVDDRLQKLREVLDTRRFRDSLKGAYLMDERIGAPYFDAARSLCREIGARLGGDPGNGHAVAKFI